MEIALIRTGSVGYKPPVLSGSQKIKLSRTDSLTGKNSGENSQRLSVHLQNTRRAGSGLRRSASSAAPARVVAEMEVAEEFRRSEYGGVWPELEEVGFSGDGGRRSGGGGGGGSGGSSGEDLSRIGDYYKRLLKSNPNDPLILRNYAKFLHEVEGDMEKAEEYYGRAILANPGDGEVLSLYGKLIWDSQQDGERAKSYFDQAVSASPNDCMVLGSYAHFMWEADEDDDDEEINVNGLVSMAAKQRRLWASCGDLCHITATNL